MCSGDASKICLGGIQAQPVEMVFVDPIRGICGDMLPYGASVFAVEVDGRAPLVAVAFGECLLKTAPGSCTVGPYVVLNSIQDPGQARSLRIIDEAAEFVGLAINGHGRKPAHTVVSQPNLPGKSATGIISTAVMPSFASSGNSCRAAPQVLSRVKVPMCISYI
jgi:hypothetical protein